MSNLSRNAQIVLNLLKESNEQETCLLVDLGLEKFAIFIEKENSKIRENLKRERIEIFSKYNAVDLILR